jgi:hypothetical protein
MVVSHSALRRVWAMHSVKKVLVAMVGLAVSVSVVMPPGARAQAPAHPLDEQLANTPAPWTVPGKWGPRGNWGRWGEQDKRGMLNFITPEMIVKAVGLVKQGRCTRSEKRCTATCPGSSRPADSGCRSSSTTTDTIG